MTRWMITLALAALCAVGCEQETAAANPPAASEAAPATTVSADAKREIDRALVAYEHIRAELVEDRVEFAESARTIATAAAAAKAHAPSSLHAHLDAMATSANALAEMSTGDAEALREGFGNVSRPLVALMRAAPSLQRGFHIFHCPMAQDYGNWIQRSANISNPYMGQRMLQCGAEVEFGS